MTDSSDKFVIGVAILWLLIGAAIFKFFVKFLIKGQTGVLLCMLYAVGAALFFSPGIIVGHGVAPFPGGLAFLLISLDSSFQDWDPFNQGINLVSWTIATVVFVLIGTLELRKKRRQA